MPKTLIVAEKPSVGREIAKVLGLPGKGGGFLAGERHVVTWAIGHLIGIAEPGDQDAAWAGRWRMSVLPMVPTRFKLAVLPTSARQYEIVRSLMGRDDITDIINATDAGREGELIFRRIYMMAGCDKPVRRLWANDMTEQGLKKALAGTVPDSEKRNLGLAAYARSEADWLVGMNYSRLFTLRDGSLITVGRVQTPVLKLLVDRRREIEHFVSRDYWTVEAELAHGEETFTAIWHAPPEYKETRIDVEADASAVAQDCLGKDGAVLSVESAARQQKPPLPFDLTTLQREANSRFGLSAKETLTIAQGLYERRKLITYPRTDSRHLTRELFKEALDHLRAIYHLFPDESRAAAERIQGGKHKFECVNDKKVSDHHAIIPTGTKAVRGALSNDEWKIYEMICRRFCATFMGPAKFAASTIWVDIAGHRFKATGKVFKDLGWLVAEPWRAASDNPLPKLRKGSGVAARSLESKKHQTKPPAHFTDATLLGAMETAGKLVDDEELREAMKERGLGTPATRAQIIETLLSRKYLEKDKKKIIATDSGCHAVDLVEGHLPTMVSPELTGEWEKRLSDIEQGRASYPDFMRDIRHSVVHGVNSVRGTPDRSGMKLFDRRVDINGFPLDSSPTSGPATDTASPPRPASAAKPQAAANPPATDSDGFPVAAAAAAPSAASPPAEALGACPLCGRDVVEWPEAFECVGTPEGACTFGVKRTLFGGELRDNLMRDLLAKGRTFKRTRFVSKAGKPFHANLKLVGGKVELSFDD